jgi:hypothetical protein
LRATDPHSHRVQVNKLSKLAGLTSLSLHGNEIEKTEGEWPAWGTARMGLFT